MKNERKVIIASIALGLFVWATDAVLDYFLFFPKRTFWELLLFDMPGHAIYARMIVLACFVGFGLVTAHMLKQQRQLQEQLDYQANLLQNVSDAIIATDLDFRIQSWNQAAETIYGWPAEEVIGQTVMEVLKTQFPDEQREGSLKQLFETGIWKGEVIQRRRSGQTFYALASVSLLKDRAGQPVGTLAANRDITRRKQTQDALRESEERFRRLVENAPDIMYRYRLFPTPGLEYISPAVETITGYTPAAFLSDPKLWLKLIHIGEQPAGQPPADTPGDFPRPFVLRMTRQDGTTIWTEQRNVPIYDEQGQLIAIEGIARDITERKILEAQLRQSQKMEAIGRLAGGVAHDFNNILTVINSYSELILARLDGQEGLYREVEQIRQAGERAAGLTRQLLTFSRRQVLETKIVSLNEVVMSMQQMLQRLAGANITLETILNEALGQIRADPSQVEQILLNLTVNARDAMPQGGQLVIQTENIDLGEQEAGRRAGLKPGPYVMLTVSDTGSGMDEKTLAHIFEPFFTTKEQGKGTGLGLSTVYGIVKQSGGDIWVESEPGRGTTFSICLPRIA
jgi:PAS domain S-box-containing protein